MKGRCRGLDPGKEGRHLLLWDERAVKKRKDEV